MSRTTVCILYWGGGGTEERAGIEEERAGRDEQRGGGKSRELTVDNRDERQELRVEVVKR